MVNRYPFTVADRSGTSEVQTRTNVSAVIYDSAGNVIGGSTGRNSDELLPGVRAYFQSGTGADAIPFDRVGSASVSMLGAYQAIA